MENEHNPCYRCKNLERFYTRGVKQFNKTKVGWCCKKVAVVNIHDSCEKYEPRKPCKRISRAIKFCLNDLLTDISAIREIIEDERRENEEV
ncbi:MAG: hypothetical protein HDT28_08380 [Clostridiales bacterium]|nr:hypothetical protein [Clostridiales bacterium]